MAAEAMELASDLGNKGQLDKARDLLKRSISMIKESVSANDPFCKE